MKFDPVRELAAALAKAPPEAPKVILDALRDLRVDLEPQNRGICGHVEEYLYEEYADGDDECEQEESYQAFWEATKRVFFKTWPGSSGDPVFPISVDPGSSPASQYADALDYGTIWDGEYGAARERLLMYLIDEYAGLLMPGHAAHYEHNQPEESQ